MINARTTAVALICMLAGCFSGPPVKIEHLDYPAYFPAPMPAASGCPDLTGRYRNADSGSKPRLLAELGLSRTTTPLDHIHLVEIDGPRQGGVVLRLVEGPVADDGSGGAVIFQTISHPKRYRGVVEIGCPFAIYEALHANSYFTANRAENSFTMTIAFVIMLFTALAINTSKKIG